MQTISQILDNNEQIFWEGKPKFLPFLLNESNMILLSFGLIWSSFTLWIPFVFGVGYSFLPHVFLGPLFVFGPTIYRYLVYKNVHYAITNKRILIESGLIGRDISSIDFDQITDLSVNVGLFDKLFNQNTGSIFIMTTSTFKQTKNGIVPHPHELDSIFDPYVIFKKLKEVSHSVKTDIEYPNAIRPTNNPGYNTKLETKTFENQQ